VLTPSQNAFAKRFKLMFLQGLRRNYILKPFHMIPRFST
jgi:hypothetical protein